MSLESKDSAEVALGRSSTQAPLSHTASRLAAPNLNGATSSRKPFSPVSVLDRGEILVSAPNTSQKELTEQNLRMLDQEYCYKEGRWRPKRPTVSQTSSWNDVIEKENEPVYLYG